MIISILLSIFATVAPAIANAAEGNGLLLSSSVIHDASSGQGIASAIQICPSRDLPTYTFATAAHVVETSSRLSILNLELRSIWVDSDSDFALLTPANPRALGTVFALTCKRLGTDLISLSQLRSAVSFPVAPSTLHLSPNARQKSSVVVRVQGFNATTGQPRSEFLRTPIVFTNISGIPGRDSIGSILQMEAGLLPGASGSGVFIYLDEETGVVYDGPAVDPCAGSLLCRWSPRFLGMVATVAPSTRTVGVVPVWTIAEGLEASHEPSRISVPGGVRYLQSGIIHYRNPSRRAFSAARSQDASGARGGDGSGARGGDGSGARGGDGGALTSYRFSSGLVFPDSRNERWLDLTGLWAENEPFNEKIWLEAGSIREGIYEKNGELIRSSARARWPVWLDLSRLNVTSRAQADYTCHSFRANRVSVQPDSFVFDNSRPMIRLCERGSVMNHSMQVEIIEGRRSLKVLQLELTDQGNGRLETRAIDDRGSILNRDGLRTFENSKWRIEIDASAGVRIRRKGPQSQLGPIWVGPRIP